MEATAEFKDRMVAPQLVYVAGPYRADTPWKIEQNIRKAEALGLEVARMGSVPIIPHSMYRFFQDSLPDEFWLAATLEILDQCDALILVEGWPYSEGSKAEKESAERKDIPVFHKLVDLHRWLGELSA